MMKCDEVTRLAGDYLERRLPLGERLRVLVHLALCEACRIYIEQFRLTVFALRSVPRPDGDAPSESLMEHFRRHTHPPGK